MEKLRFTIRFMILLGALPVIMFTELTRDEKTTTEHKQIIAEKVSKKSEVAMLNYHSPFMQAIL